ncbi:MAG: S4 domain-containing protein [Sphingomonas sp.]
MRLDRFLWFVRLAKTRSAAQALAQTGSFRIDGRRVERGHAPVRVGSTLAFVQGNWVRVIRIEKLPPRRGPAPEAQACYSDLVAENVSQEPTGVDGGGIGA